MNTEQLTEVITALHGFCMAQASQLMAHRTVIDAMIATLATSLPPLAEELSKHLDELAERTRESVSDNSLSWQSYDSVIAAIQDNLKILSGR